MQHTITKRTSQNVGITTTRLMLEALYELTNRNREPFPMERLTKFYYKSGLVADYDMSITADGKVFSRGVADDFDTLFKADLVALDGDKRIYLTPAGEKRIDEDLIGLPIPLRVRIAEGRLATSGIPAYAINKSLEKILHTKKLV